MAQTFDPANLGLLFADGAPPGHRRCDSCRVRMWLAVTLFAACHKDAAPEGPCTCTPANTIKSKAIGEAAPMTGQTVLAALRRHAREVAAKTNPRDIKMLDDQLRFAITELCQPCGDWVTDRMTMEEMFPFGKLDDATSAVCLGLVLHDGTTAYGDVRPANCR
jgi:hypothetical protein